HHARGRIPSGAIEPVREAMQQNGMHAGITQQDFEHTACGRVTPEYRIDLLPQCAKHVRSLLYCCIEERTAPGAASAHKFQTPGRAPGASCAGFLESYAVEHAQSYGGAVSFPGRMLFGAGG